MSILQWASLHNHQTNQKPKETNTIEAPIKKTEITILLQPFTDFPKADLLYISTQLRKIYGKVAIQAPIEFPNNSLNQSKKRHRAEIIIRFLSNQTKEGNLTIGLTTRDISTTKGNMPDWGIMGLGYCPGKSCIVSSYRIKGKNKWEKVFKVAIHELGHTQGLPHCPIPTCLMRDAKGKDTLDEEKAFCPKCKGILIKAGWALQ
jgi:archaemetzincin